MALLGKHNVKTTVFKYNIKKYVLVCLTSGGKATEHSVNNWFCLQLDRLQEAPKLITSPSSKGQWKE